MYTFDYEFEHTDNGNGEDTAKAKAQGVLFHANVYALGEKHGANSVKDTALEKFREAVESQWNETVFPDVVMLVYESTPETDRGLRDLVTKRAADHAKELLKSEDNIFNAMMGKVADFGRDLSIKLASLIQMVDDHPAYRCPSSRVGFSPNACDAVELLYCSCCGQLVD